MDNNVSFSSYKNDFEALEPDVNGFTVLKLCILRTNFLKVETKHPLFSISTRIFLVW